MRGYLSSLRIGFFVGDGIHALYQFVFSIILVQKYGLEVFGEFSANLVLITLFLMLGSFGIVNSSLNFFIRSGFKFTLKLIALSGITSTLTLFLLYYITNQSVAILVFVFSQLIFIDTCISYMKYSRGDISYMLLRLMSLIVLLLLFLSDITFFSLLVYISLFRFLFFALFFSVFRTKNENKDGLDLERKEVINYSSNTLVHALSIFALVSVDRKIMELYFSYEDIGTYVLIYQGASILTIFFQASNKALIGVLSDSQKYIEKAQLYLKIASVLALALVLIYPIVLENVYGLVGATSNLGVLFILVLATFFYFGYQVRANILTLRSSRADLLLISSLSGLLLAVVLLILFKDKYGLEGVAISTLCSFSVMYLITRKFQKNDAISS